MTGDTMIIARLQQHPHNSLFLCTIPEEESLCFVPSSSLQTASGIKDDDVTLGHELVNQSRIKLGLHTLRRSSSLDRLALEHAEHMAEHRRVYHSVKNIEALQTKLERRYLIVLLGLLFVPLSILRYLPYYKFTT